MTWGFKYKPSGSNHTTGIAPHADTAAVNLNFWVTPNESNLDPDSGGLVVYEKLVTGAEVSEAAYQHGRAGFEEHFSKVCKTHCFSAHKITM